MLNFWRGKLREGFLVKVFKLDLIYGIKYLSVFLLLRHIVF